MDIEKITILVVSIGVVLIVWYLFRNIICKIIERLSLGLIIVLIVNCMIPAYEIGINWITLGCIGILGMPGVMTLYIINMVI